MAIVRVNPKSWDAPDTDIEVVQVDSTAQNLRDAILDIEDWAAEHNFARVTGEFPREILQPDGKRVFRGICFKWTGEEQRSADLLNERMTQALGRMPVTPHRVEDYR